jgi:hypothetical protein
VAFVNLRGSIEQCFSDYMTGPPHDEHHRCVRLDWDIGNVLEPLSHFFYVMHDILMPFGILAIHANGTRSTDRWYSATVKDLAGEAGFEIVDQRTFLFHKWVKP